MITIKKYFSNTDLINFFSKLISNFFICHLSNLILISQNYINSPLLIINYVILIFNKKLMIVGIIIISIFNIFEVTEFTLIEFYYLFFTIENNYLNLQSLEFLIFIFLGFLISVLLIYLNYKYNYIILIPTIALFILLFIYYLIISDNTRKLVNGNSFIKQNKQYISSILKSEIIGVSNIKKNLNNIININEDFNKNFDNTIALKLKKAINNKSNIIIIINESGSFFKDPNINSKLNKSLVKNDYLDFEKLNWNKILWTIGGELQGVCGLSFNDAMKYKKKTAGISQLKDALINGDCNILLELKQKKYDTFFYHSSYCNFHGRCDYNDVFDKTFFLDEINLHHKNISDCNWGWKGKCDDEIVPLIGDLISNTNSNNKFIVFLTVNAHAPIISSKKNNFNCSDFFSLKNSKELCNLAKIQYNFFDTINEYIINNMKKNDLLIILGDHPPALFKYSDLNSLEKYMRIQYYIK